MAGTRAWSTKADILKDLYQVSGRTGDVDEEFIIMGQKPPPPRRCKDDDDEIAARFGVQTNSSFPFDRREHSPDLQGITDMLRIVNDYNDVECEIEESGPPSATEGLIISKLDPNVAEFVPKALATSSPNSDKENNSSNNQSSTEKDTSTSGEDKKDCIEIGKRIDVSKLNPDEISDISKKLRSKISDVSNKDNLHSKRERNVAIATLLKIYSAAPIVQEVSNVDKPIKLLSPEYFERTANANKELEITVKPDDGDSTLGNNVSNSGEENIPIEEDSKTELDKKDEDTSISPSAIKTPVENKHYEDEQVRESISKVNQWFKNPKSRKPKGPVVCLGPIEFKKKNNNPRSPVNSDIESKRSTPTKAAIGNYRPSQYAQDLSKKFVERNKTRELQQQDIWERVQIEMKRKEEKMKQKQLEMSSAESNSQDGSTIDDPETSTVSQ